MSKIESNKVSNPFKENSSEEKTAKMKTAQEKRRTSLFTQMEEQRGLYKAQQKALYEARTLFEEKSRLSGLNESDTTLAQDAVKAKQMYCKSQSSTDYALSILQFRTDSFCSANRLNLIDFA